MPRSRIFGLYMLLGVFALGAGLLVARLFGSTPALPTISATPVASAITEAPAPTDAGLATTPGASSQTVTPTSDLETAAPAPTSAARPTIPAATTAAPASGYIEYTVQKGDSLKGIGEKYNVTIREIIAVNEIPNPDSLVVGSVLRIPKK